jgi:hypothetical protein
LKAFKNFLKRPVHKGDAREGRPTSEMKRERERERERERKREREKERVKARVHRGATRTCTFKLLAILGFATG